jgi:type II secretion system protein N
MSRLARFARWMLYPAFYLFCLGLFSYFTFPWDHLKTRIEAEFLARQKPKPGEGPTRLVIGSLRPSWGTGVELTDVHLLIAPTPEQRAAAKDADGKEATPKDTDVVIDRARARLKLLPLLLGRVRIDVDVEAFGGTLEGTVPVGTSSGPLELELKDIELAQMALVEHEVGVPLAGRLSGKIELSPSEGKFAKASGSLALTIAELVVADGKKKIKNLITLPPARAGDLTIAATATDGAFKLEQFSATGPHLELVGDGKIVVREPFTDSPLDLLVRFKFTDSYKGLNDTTKSLFGAPGIPPLIESQEPKMKRAKRTDGFYGWHVHGPLKKLKYDPSSADTAAGAPKGATKTKADSPFAGTKTKKPPKVTRDKPSMGRPSRGNDDGGEAPMAEAPERGADRGAPEPAPQEAVAPAPPPGAPPAEVPEQEQAPPAE